MASRDVWVNCMETVVFQSYVDAIDVLLNFLQKPFLF